MIDINIEANKRFFAKATMYVRWKYEFVRLCVCLCN